METLKTNQPQQRNLPMRVKRPRVRTLVQVTKSKYDIPKVIILPAKL